MSENRHKNRVKFQFGRAAAGYANSSIHARGASLDLMLAWIQPQPEWKMLDVATGAGHTAFLFSPLVHDVTATDLTDNMLAQAAELAGQKGIHNVQFRHADAEQLPFSEAGFDLLTCRLALHHFPDQPTAVKEFARVLKPGGRLGFVDNITIAQSESADHHNTLERIRDPSHFRLRTAGDLLQMIERAGFQIDAQKQLSKEIEFHDWADRQQVDIPDKQRLWSMLEDMPRDLHRFLQPRKADDTFHFLLWEIVVVATAI